MVIDARGIEPHELFLRLRETLASRRGVDVFIEILFDTRSTSQRAKAFVSMTGCRAEIEEREGHYLLRITGSPCCV